jgi:excisionase family DNA binding protein
MNARRINRILTLALELDDEERNELVLRLVGNPERGGALTLKQIAAQMEVSYATVKKWVATGKLRTHKGPGKNGKHWVFPDALRSAFPDWRPSAYGSLDDCD